ncbi:MAG: shikimate kinase [Candidatus Roizmanbacteria bacterium]
MDTFNQTGERLQPDLVDKYILSKIPELYEGHKKAVKFKEQPISISGPSAVGKSTISRLLAEALGYRHFDLDVEASKRAGLKTTKEVFAQFGHAAFKHYQHDAIAEITGTTEKYVLAAGGEIWRPGYDENLIKANRELIANNTFNICLIPSSNLNEVVDVLYPRLNDGKRDTRTNGPEEFAHYVDLGIQQYFDLAQATVFVHFSDAQSVLEFILDKVLALSGSDS